MESRFHGVPPSAAQMAPPYKGIRAPLTVDESDFEYSVSSKSHRNSTTSSYYSGSELESDGFESGEDELETVSERPPVVEKDEGILEETHFVKGFTFSEPSVKSPDEGFGQESGSVSGNAVLRPFVRIPDRMIYKGSGNVDDSDDSGSFLSDSGDELVKDESYVVKYSDSRPLVAVQDEEVSENGQSPLVDARVSLVQKLHIPIAQISADSDEDSQGSGVSDGEGFSGIVRIPSIEVLRRINSAPKVRISESDDGEDDESQGESVQDLVISDVVLDPSDEKEHFDVENLSQREVLADIVQDKGLDIEEEALYNSLVENEEFDSSLELGQNGDSIHFDEEIQDIGVIDEQKKCVELVDKEELDSTSESGQNGDAMHFGGEIQEIDVFDEHKKCVELVDNELDFTSESGQNGDPMPLDEEIQEIVIDEEKWCVELVDHRVPTDFSEGVMFPENISDHSDRKEKVESDREHEICSIRQYVDIKEVPAEGCGEFPELPGSLTESMQVYMSDRLFEDAILTGVIDAGESVLGGFSLDHENRKDENSDRLSSEVEESTFHSETKAVIAEINSVPDSTSLANREISLDLSQEIGGQIVTNSHEEVDADGGVSDRVPPSTNIGELEEVLSERDWKKIEKIQQIRVRYLLLLHRLHCSPEDSVASKVLYQLTLAEKSSSSQAFHLDSTKKVAMEFEAQKKDDLDFSLSILVIGKTGVGKSATINSIFGEKKAVIDAFEPSTTHVKEIIGTIDGIKLKIFDTPGLRSSFRDQSINRKIFPSIKKLMRKSPPDIILYVDRLDTRTSLSDVPLLKSLTSYLGSSIWRKSIIAFTHGTSTLPDGPNGYPSSYEVFVSQQALIIQQLIGHSMIPVCVVENHPFAEKNGIGETLLRKGERWRSHLLLLCYSTKILSELSSTVMIHNPLNHRIAIMSSLFQSYGCPELLNDQSGDDVVLDNVLCYSSDSDKETVALPPSFDGDNPSFVYRLLEPSSRLLTMPVFDSPWDHEDVNETPAGLSISFVGGNVATSPKVKDRLAVGKRLILVGNDAFVRFSVGRNSRLNVNIALDSNLRGSDQLQIAAMTIVPIARAVFKKIFGQSTD